MGLFKHNGVHCVVDGQFGSTGKGALSAYLAEIAIKGGHDSKFSGTIYSGGPNSGHTFYYHDEKIVLKQLPVFSAYMNRAGIHIPAYLSAGAIIDRDILRKEAEAFPGLQIFVHPNAAIVTDEDKKNEENGPIAEVAGTRSGTGEALVRKIRRMPSVIASNSLGLIAHNVSILNHRIKPERNSYFMEVSQGFSLGINSHFYPKVTSRECTVMQGLADARISPRQLARVYMAVRTFPIRVGDVDGHSSGGWYHDQHETNWENLGVTPEITTVTKRIRRVASFSMTQFIEACWANDPDCVFVSHMDYLDENDRASLMEDLTAAKYHMGKHFDFLVASGPKVGDVKREESILWMK
jgi:adenylosuccinate synthase